MKTILIISVLFALACGNTITVTEANLDKFYDDCFDYNNHPYNTWFEEEDSYAGGYRMRRQLEDYDSYNGYDEDYESYTYEYECDAQCEEDLDTYIQDVKDINENQAVKPCDEWWEYELSANYDSSNIDINLLFTYIECLQQLTYMNFESDQYAILECTALSIDEYLWQNDFYEYQGLVLEAADIDNCEAQCVTDIDCDANCQTFIDDYFNNDFDICVEAEVKQQNDIDKEIIQVGDWTEDGAWIYQECIYENLWEVTEFEELYWKIDWDILYESQTYENDYQVDYSVFDNLETKQKGVVTLDCQVQCYYYFNLYEEEYYYDGFYDNEHVILELYGQQFYDDYIDNYYGDYEDEDTFWEDDEFYEGLDCYEDECFDENGEFIGQNYNEDDYCDTEYCFVEFNQCIKKCGIKNCPDNTCYDLTKGQSLTNYIEKICSAFNKLKEQYELQGIIKNTAIVPPKYYDSYGQCIAKLQEAEDLNEEREDFDKTYITQYYTCLTSCTEEEVYIQESGGKNDDGEDGSQSRLILTLSTLVFFALILL